MISVNPNRVKPALVALVACSFVGLAGCGSSASSVEVGGGSAASVAAGEASGSVSADCISGSGGGASATVCADADGNASVQATVDDGTDVTIDASSDEGTDTSTEVTTGGGSATTVKAATGTTCAADFPLPSGADVLSCSDDGKLLDLLATVTDVEAAYDFYLDALPAAGYTINQQDAANLAGVYGASIDFTGGGVKTGSVVITDLGSKGMTISLQR